MIKKITRAAVVSVALIASSAKAMATDVQSCDGSIETSRGIVLAFYNEGLVSRQPQKAFLRYMSPDFIEHKPDIPKGTRDETAKFLAQIIADVPEAKWEVVRTIAEKDMVFLHARFTPAPGAPAYALADIFRVKGCKIIEHWDVVGPPPKEQMNPQPRF